jgi:hypothetical protein
MKNIYFFKMGAKLKRKDIDHHGPRHLSSSCPAHISLCHNPLKIMIFSLVNCLHCLFRHIFSKYYLETKDLKTDGAN